MYFIALATDYDGTLAEDGRLADSTLGSLRRLKQSGRKLILVTGRILPDLQRVLPHVDLFDTVVVENGALLFEPLTGAETLLTEEPAPVFVEELRRRGVSPLSIGRSIVATLEPNEKIVLEIIRDLGLELQIIFNKGAVMVLPAGVNKASGLSAALTKLQLSPFNVVGIGDAENDHAFLRACGCAVAVANALPMVKADADIVTDAPRGAGVAETIERILDTDLVELAPRIERQTVEFAHDAKGEPVRLNPQSGGVLIVGASGGGKSTTAAGLVEQITAVGFQFCLLDPEGNYADLEGVVVIGDTQSPPRIPNIIAPLMDPRQSVVVNLLGVDLAERPRFLSGLTPAIAELHSKTARPHWLVIDEAHHLLPSLWDGAPPMLPPQLTGIVLIAVDPESIAPDALQRIEFVAAIGADAERAIASFCEITGKPAPGSIGKPPERGQALLWRVRSAELRIVSPIQPRLERQRHIRKYAEGELGEDNSFYFRGPEGALNLRAQNLALFIQIATGVDDRTWEYHLRAGDYSRWFRDKIKDFELASEVAGIERSEALIPADSRRLIKEAIDRRYTGSA
jgi:HAD superfamily hydrolase (TIGR01484 family)